MIEMIANAAGYNPITASVLVFILFLWVNFIERTIEKLIFGKGFIHWLDPIILFSFMVFNILVIARCIR